MNKYTRDLTVLLAALFAVAMLTACSEKKIDLPFPNTPPSGSAEQSLANGPMQRNSDGTYSIAAPEENSGKVIPTTTVNQVKHSVRKFSRKVQYGFAWGLLVAGILLPGPLLIFLIPGLVTGRGEKMLEGALIFAVGVFMAGLVKEAGVTSLESWVWFCLLGPGALLFLWGLITKNEAGKVILVIGPTLIFALFAFGQGFHMLVMGIIGSAIFTFFILAILVATLAGAVSRIGGSETA